MNIRGVTCAAVLAVEAIGSLAMWLPIPFAWLWVGGRVYDATGSIGAAGCAAILGLLLTASLTIAVLTWIDDRWVALRRRAGYDQAQGALTRVVVASATLAIAAFMVWNVINQAFIMPFMPTH
jgi:hypothetical protein